MVWYNYQSFPSGQTISSPNTTIYFFFRLSPHKGKALNNCGLFFLLILSVYRHHFGNVIVNIITCLPRQQCCSVCRACILLNHASIEDYINPCTNLNNRTSLDMRAWRWNHADVTGYLYWKISEIRVKNQLIRLSSRKKYLLNETWRLRGLNIEVSSLNPDSSPVVSPSR